MSENQNSKHVFDLEERSFNYAKRIRDYMKNLPKSISNLEYGKQGIRSSGSVASNYIEANESLGKKDFKMRIRICRKEGKETILWLRLSEPLKEHEIAREALIGESWELIKIFGTILKNSE